ncbi:MAG: threonylcarbamoyl-AMP synthase [Deltaproteobacteria bacterium]|nr:threonylcarbamoyl-AMP synthase [Deltaproteobacteria bacterium]
MTKILTIDPQSATYEELTPAAEILLAGGLIAGPTQSFYALMALADKSEALERLNQLKAGRREDQAFLLLLDCPARTHSYAREVSIEAETLMANFWPGLLTLLMTGHTGLEPFLLGRSKTVGLRVEGLESIRRLIRMVDRGVTGTSANPHGAKPPTTVAEVLASFDGRIDLVLDGGPTFGHRSSTIVDLSGPEPRIHRQGAVKLEDIRSVCPSVIA